MFSVLCVIKHISAELLTNAPLAPATCGPEDGAPQGHFDKICYNVFLYGAFRQEYGNIQGLLEAMEAEGGHRVQAEFAACRIRYIQLFLAGKVTMKMRKTARDKIDKELCDVRKQVVNQFEEQGRDNITKFKCTAIVRWRQLNPGKCPYKEGENVGMEFHEGEMREVVRTRKYDEGEWDLSVRSTTAVRKSECLSDGNDIRENAADLIYTDAAKKRGVDWQEYEGGKKLRALELVAAAPRATAEDKNKDGEDDDSDSHSESHNSLLNDGGSDSDNLLSSVGGKKKGKAKAKQNKPTGKARVSSSNSAASTAMPSTPAKDVVSKRLEEKPKKEFSLEDSAELLSRSSYVKLCGHSCDISSCGISIRNLYCFGKHDIS